MNHSSAPVLVAMCIAAWAPPATGAPNAHGAKASRSVHAPGKVVPDETHLYRVNAGVAGSLRDVADVTPGDRVRKDQVLGSFYAPDAISVIQLFIAA